MKLRTIGLVALMLFLGACDPTLTANGEATPVGRSSATIEAPPSPSAALPACDWARVARVVDGDTIRVRLGGREEPVRYIGIDTPETVHPTLPVQPFGPEASARNQELVAGRWVCLERDVTDRDRYGRLLRYAWLDDGTLVNETLLAAGLATVSTYPPDVKYVESRYLPAQRSARDAGLGIWSEPASEH